jgi:hypothetical protein
MEGGGGIDRGKPKYWEENLSQHHFVCHKSHIARATAMVGGRLRDGASAWRFETRFV